MKIDIEYCKFCGGESGYFDTEENHWVDIPKHRVCKRIAEFESLSIFDKNSKNNTFDVAEISNSTEKMYLEDFKKYCNRFELAKEKGVGMFFTGNAGAGKTYYSNCIGNELKKMGHTVLSFNLSGYLNTIRPKKRKNEFNQIIDDNEGNEQRIIEAITLADAIIIDDMGNESMTTWTQEKIFNLLNTVYLHRKPLICSSNLTGEGLQKHFDMNGSNKIVDRLLELCKGYTFSWNSRRLRKGKENFKEIFK